MLAISRALLANPKLLVMDEPTEGLAPVIVDQVADMLLQLGHDGDMAILVIEQNIGVATSVSDTVAIMVNGQINRTMEAQAFSPPTAILQQRLLGVGRHADELEEPVLEAAASGESAAERMAGVYCRLARGGRRCAVALRVPSGPSRRSRTAGTCRRPACVTNGRSAQAGSRRGRQEGLSDPIFGADRKGSFRGRNLRHQGPGTGLYTRLSQEARDPGSDDRSVDLAEAIARAM